MKTLRCAIYTRKSSEEGLEQEFNSLHAQREACEAYIRSQAGEGWRPLKAHYDDGGFSGGTMERPGLKALLADVAAGKVDIVIVYKVDRLTRSLSDFAKIVDVFDQRQTAFVSVTQAFNTTTSMGRLMLNVLLSFAQFEREVTGERIRDKIAASKRKGLWMGGCVPLGYKPSGRTLVINEGEADQVRHIFRRYLELKSVRRLKAELEAEGFRSKRRVLKDGRTVGGAVIGRGPLFHLLSNRLYRGEIVHKGEVHPGQHPAIVDEETFEAAQRLLASNRVDRKNPSRPGSSPLVGRIFDQEGRPMSPTVALGRGRKRYRYYVSTALQRGEGVVDPEGIHRLPAEPLERFLQAAIQRITGHGGRDMALEALDRVTIKSDAVLISLRPVDRSGADVASQACERLAEGERAWMEDGRLHLLLPVRLVFRGGRNWIVSPTGVSPRTRPRPNRVLISALQKAHRIARRANVSPLQPADAIRSAADVKSPYERKLLNLAFLAPDIQRAIIRGEQPAALTLQELLDNPIPLAWSEQRDQLLRSCYVPTKLAS